MQWNALSFRKAGQQDIKTKMDFLSRDADWLAKSEWNWWIILNNQNKSAISSSNIAVSSFKFLHFRQVRMKKEHSFALYWEM